MGFNIENIRAGILCRDELPSVDLVVFPPLQAVLQYGNVNDKSTTGSIRIILGAYGNGNLKRQDVY